MLFVDSRVGSGDLLPLLTSLGAPAVLTTLEFGDCAWCGNGPDGRPVQVAVELKKLNDMLQCIATGRFAGHQLPGLASNYDESWLVIEGVYRPNPQDGVLEVRGGGGWRAVSLGRRSWMYRDFEAFLTTMEIKGGMRLRRTGDRHETARLVAGLYAWWTKGEYAEHRSHLAFNRARDVALLTKPTLLRRVAAELPGVGFTKSAGIASHFDSVRAMVNADVREWKQAGIGKVLAERIITALTGETHG